MIEEWNLQEREGKQGKLVEDRELSKRRRRKYHQKIAREKARGENVDLDDGSLLSHSPLDFDPAYVNSDINSMKGKCWIFKTKILHGEVNDPVIVSILVIVILLMKFNKALKNNFN